MVLLACIHLFIFCLTIPLLLLPVVKNRALTVVVMKVEQPIDHAMNERTSAKNNKGQQISGEGTNTLRYGTKQFHDQEENTQKISVWTHSQYQERKKQWRVDAACP